MNIPWDGKLPATVGVKLKEPPVATLPLLNVVPSSDVTVCVVLSLFVHLTAIPTLTVIERGEKLIPLMLTVVPPTTGGTVVPPVPYAPPDLLQESIAILNKKQKIKADKMFLLFINTVLIFFKYFFLNLYYHY